MDKSQGEILSEIASTRIALGEKLDLFEDRCRGTVEDARSSVEDTIDNISQKMEKTMENVKQTLDPVYQTQNHPWIMLGGSVVLGAVIGGWLTSRPARKFAKTPAYQLEKKEASSEFAGYRPADTQEPPEAESWDHPSLNPEQTKNPVLETIKTEFADEIKMVKGIAVESIVNYVARRAKEVFPDISDEIEQVRKSAKRKIDEQDLLSKKKEPESSEREPKFRAI